MAGGIGIKPKYEKLVEEYAGKIAAGMPPGTYLPSAREMARKHSVSVGTVQQAVACLREMGLVVPLPWRGYMVAERPRKRHDERHVGLAMVGGSERPKTVGERVQAFLEAMDSPDAMALRLWSGPKGQADYLAKWAGDLDGLLLWGHVDSPLISSCLKRCAACVVVGSIDDKRCPPGAGHVDGDARCALALAVNHLAALGHRCIAFLHGSGYRPDEDAADEFDRLASGPDGHAFLRIPFPANSLDVSSADVFAALRQLPEIPTAFLAAEWNIVVAVLEALEASGVAVPEGASVVGLTKPAPLPGGAGATTSVHRTMGDMARRAMMVLREMMDGAPPSREILHPQILRGETCAPPPCPAAVQHEPF